MNCPSASIARAARMLGTAKGPGPGLPGKQPEGEFKAHLQARLRSSPGGMAFSGRHKGRPSGGVRSVAPREASRDGGALRRLPRSPPPFLSLKRTEKQGSDLSKCYLHSRDEHGPQVPFPLNWIARFLRQVLIVSEWHSKTSHLSHPCILIQLGSSSRARHCCFITDPTLLLPCGIIIPIEVYLPAGIFVALLGDLGIKPKKEFFHARSHSAAFWKTGHRKEPCSLS